MLDNFALDGNLIPPFSLLVIATVVIAAATAEAIKSMSLLHDLQVFSVSLSDVMK